MTNNVKCKNSLNSLAYAALLCCAMLIPAKQTFAGDWEQTVSGASTRTFNLAGSCGHAKIKVSGASTAHLKGVSCDKVTVEIRGASTVSIMGTRIGEITGTVKSGSTLLTPFAIIGRDNVTTSGGSTFNTN
jgi:hypothetical protein